MNKKTLKLKIAYFLLAIFLPISILMSACDPNPDKVVYDSLKPSYDSEKVAGVFVPADLANLTNKQYSSVVIIVGNTANQPVPTISKNVAGYLAMAWMGENVKTTIISASGTKTHDKIAVTIPKTINKSGNESRNQQAEVANINAINEAINVDPAKNHLDFFGAIKDAVALVRGESGDKLVVVIGSGLNDCGYLNFAANPDLVNDDAKEVAKDLVGEQTGVGVDATSLDGVDVILSGIGHGAAPQTDKLEPSGVINSLGNLENLYKTILEDMGANVVVDNSTEHHKPTSVDTSNVVTPMHLVMKGPDPNGIGDDGVLISEKTLNFVPDTAEFKDYSATVQALTPIAETLKNSKQKVQILGYQALPPGGSVTDLPENRAWAVRNLLVDALGVDPSQIVECRGDGAGKLANEYDENGKWDTNLAQANRVVLVKPV
ncbi:MAG: hypothetical protein LBG97_08325 [Coriobacteriales bacterium]|jgi:hypothetical protein|nr:hypothetical protein [Coriobacteriales bacterium]